jgi:hypothetical protein
LGPAPEARPAPLTPAITPASAAAGGPAEASRSLASAAAPVGELPQRKEKERPAIDPDTLLVRFADSPRSAQASRAIGDHALTRLGAAGSTGFVRVATNGQDALEVRHRLAGEVS